MHQYYAPSGARTSYWEISMIPRSAQAALPEQSIWDARTAGWLFGSAETDSSGPSKCVSTPVFAETWPCGELERRRDSGAPVGRRRKFERVKIAHVIVDDEVKKGRDEERMRAAVCSVAGVRASRVCARGD